MKIVKLSSMGGSGKNTARHALGAAEDVNKKLAAFKDGVFDILKRHPDTRKEQLEVAITDLGASAIEIVVQVERQEDGRRRVVSLQETNGMEGEVITTSELFRFDRRGLDKQGNVLGELVTSWQLIRTSNAYQFLDPLDREPGRRGWGACKPENPARPSFRGRCAAVSR